MTTTADGTLIVTGGNQRDTIAITDNGGTGPGSIRVVTNGQEFVSTGPVKEIRIRARGGRDDVSYALTGNVVPKRISFVDLDTGGGNDRGTTSFQGTLNGDLLDALGRKSGPGPGHG